MFGATDIVKNSDKDMWVYNSYGIAFDSGDWWNFGDGTGRNVIIFGADGSSSTHVDNRKNKFLILGLSSTSGINGTFCLPEKKILY